MSSSSISCEVTVSPPRMDAGADFLLSARVICSPAEDLRGRIITFRNAEGDIAAEAEIGDFDGEVNISRRVTARAPGTPGLHGWSAEVTSDEATGGFVTPFELDVTDHETRLAVWDVPTAIEAGTEFPLRIGVKCSSGCDMTGRRFVIRDARGAEVALGQLSGAVWPGSDGLYHAEIALIAPAAETLEEWIVEIPPDSKDYPHKAATSAFRVRTVPPADCVVRIEAVDHEKGEPLGNMSVVMHPYRGRTDEDGVAQIRVARGQYSVFVSGRGYYPVQRDLEVTGDITERAPLTAEPPQSADW